MSQLTVDLEDLVATYERDGYALLSGMLDPTLVDGLGGLLQRQLDDWSDRFLQATGARITESRQMDALVAGLTGPDRAYHALDQPLQHLVRGEFPLDVRLREEVRAIADQRPLQEVLARLLGSANLRMHYPPMLRFKPPDQPQSNVPLHQDSSYNAHLERFVTVWVPFCPITDACGGVNVLAGSHRLGRLAHEERVIWGNYVEPEAGRAFEDRHVLMEPGDVLVFGPELLHYSHPNRSSRVRFSGDFRFFPGAIETDRHYYDIERGTVVAPEGVAPRTDTDEHGCAAGA